MDKQFKFNLDVAIKQYVHKINSTLALDDDDMKELEDHLHTSVQEIKLENKLHDGEAFAVAVGRLGNHEELRQQYADSSPWNQKIKLTIIGIIFFCLLRITVLLSQGLFLGFNTSEILSPLIDLDETYMANTFQLILFILIGLVGIRLFNKMVNKPTRQQLNLAVLLLILMIPLDIFTTLFPMVMLGTALTSFLMFSIINGSLLYLFFTLCMLGLVFHFKLNKRALALA